jgi:hypothetical protein
MTTEKHKSQRSETKLIGEARIAFPFHHEKRTKSAGGALLEKPRHDAVVLVPKLSADPTQCANYTSLAALCMEAATKAWGSWPQGGKWPIQNGDVAHVSKPKPGVTPKTAEQIAASNAWRKGSWVIEVSTNLDPGPRVCVLQNGVASEIPAKVVAGVQLYKSGDYGYVSLNAYSFQNQTFGVNFGYEGVLYTRPGESIGSSGPRSASQMFGTVAGMAAPVGQPAAPGAVPPGPPMPPQPQQYAPPAPPAAPPAAPPTLAPQFPVQLSPPLAPTYAPAPVAAGGPPLPPFLR